MIDAQTATLRRCRGERQKITCKVTPEGGLPLVPMVLYALTPSGVVDLPGTNRNCALRMACTRGKVAGESVAIYLPLFLDRVQAKSTQTNGVCI